MKGSYYMNIIIYIQYISVYCIKFPNSNNDLTNYSVEFRLKYKIF